MAPHLALFAPLNQALVALLAASAGLSALTTTLPPFAALQGVAASAALALGAATATLRPYRGLEVWKTHVSAALLGLTALTAVVSVLMLWLAQGAGLGSGAAAALSALLLALACALLLLILLSWWRSLLKGDPGWKGRCAAARAARAQAAGKGRGEGGVGVGVGAATAAASQPLLQRLPDWVKELLGVDEDVDVEARDGAAAGLLAAVGMAAQSTPQPVQEEAEVTVNPLHAVQQQPELAQEAVEQALPVLLPGWALCSSEEGGGHYEDAKGRVLLEPPLLLAVEGVDPLEPFECVDGTAFYWSDGRGRRGARLLAPGWRRCIQGGEVWYWREGGQLARRPEYIY